MRDHSVRKYLIRAYYAIPKDIPQFDSVSKRIYDLSVKLLYLNYSAHKLHDINVLGRTCAQKQKD